jgi:hypothetical protein
VQFTREELLQVASRVNQAVFTAAPLEQERPEKIFDLTWPNFIEGIEKIRAEHAQSTFIEEPKRAAEDMLEELIVAACNQTHLLTDISATQSLSLKVVAGERYIKGQRVYHNTFGEGIITSTDDWEDDQSFTVKFDHGGIRTLRGSIARRHLTLMR